ncbi:hypothetical protein HF086_012374 [Spodoptera exigua]|uniref:Uncharacterized protein n=1 Tax=Spodoptera exigua TaxID=7107 RepID=A0A922SC95_SPOEX|nr:hypothetical protein HF086_012374 [Spodoptera exigua]
MVQIQNLEKREKQGVQLLKQADCMWSCMEESYKKKISQSQERYKALMTECGDDIKEKTYQKNNDLKVMNMEIEELKKRIASNAKDLNARMATMASNMKSLQQKVAAENKIKKDKEIEGTKYVKEAREDLQKICRVLLQKKLENEDLRAEKDAILQEIDLLKQTFNNCKQKCGNKEKSITEELTKVENDLAEMRIKCTKCHECTDTMDIRKYCTDCPRCLTERHCLYSEDHCSNDYSMDCVCMSVKQKFLDNVFDNMYTVLERQSKTCPGKAVADCVLNCLKRSRNGKLNQETRKVLQDFILSTVKKNLNLTIVGGAVKTRCEMDPETYKQLMLCLKDVTVTRPVKEDKGTGSKKVNLICCICYHAFIPLAYMFEPCHRWGGISECHCPKGPKACVCSKAPHPPTDPPSCGLQPAEEDPAEKSCPQRESLACSTDCGMLGMPGAPSNWRREPCAGQSCPFSKNMRAAQCVLGPEPLSSEPKAHSLPPNTPKKLPEDKTVKKLAEDKTVKKLPEDKTVKKLPEDEMVSKVVHNDVMISKRRVESECDCSNLPVKYLLASKTSENKINQYCACSSNYVSRENRTPFLNKLQRRGHIKICRNNKSEQDISGIDDEKQFSCVGPRKNKKITDKSGNDIQMILCPKFRRGSDKRETSIGDISSIDEVQNDRTTLKFKSSSKTEQELHSDDASIVGKKVCETVKELMKNIVVPQMPPTTANVSSPKVEWVTLKSLYKEISSLAKLKNLSTETVNEVEVKCETLEVTNDFKFIKNQEKNITLKNEKIDTELSSDNFKEKEGSDSICYSDAMFGSFCNTRTNTNIIAEELKLKLLEDIRKTYNISFKTSFEDFNEFEDKENNLKNLRKCLLNLQETETEQNECSCINTKSQRKDGYESTVQYCFSAHDINVDTENIKQLTAEVTDTCNQGTCANFRKIKKGTQTLEFSQKEESGTTQGIKMNISENENKEQFKISIEDKSGLTSNQFTELKQTKSGRLAMELDEQLIDMIEKKSQDNPSLFVSIKNTSSGNLLVDFNTKENETDNTHKVTIRRTSSGTRLLDIHKNVINILKGSLYNKSADTHISKSIKLAMSPKKQDSLIQVVGSNKADVNTLQLHDINSEKHIIQHKAENKGERERDKNSCKDIISPSSNSQLKSINELPLPADSATKSSLGKELQRTDNLDRQKLPRLQQSSNTFDLKSQFKKLYKKGNADVEVHIKEKDGVVQTFSTVVTKTTSGTIAIYVDKKTSLKYTHVIKNEHPVLLSKITSREYFVNLDRKGRVFNAIIRKTPSEGMLIIPESRSFIEIHSQSHKSGYNIKLTIIGLQTPHALELPAILRTTSSLNYEIVLNKNIESKEKDHVNEFMENKKETTVNLHKTSSGNYIIDLDTENESHLTKQKALINKSSSGDMKVIIQKDVFESIVDLVSLESLSNDYSQPVGKLPASSREIHRENLRKLKKMDKKTSNNSQVNKNSKDHDNKKIFSKKTGVVKMTKSGQYAVMLDEETKKAFMKNLQSFLSTNSDGLIPIKRSDSGEIIINLNCGNKSKEHYGTLKITPSGNIYVVVDEEVIKTMTGRAKNKKLTDDADVGTRSQHITNIIASVNKAITTTCNGQPDDCDCDAAKCVCSELQLDTFDWSSDFKPKKIKPSIWTKANRKAGSFHLKKRSVVAKSSSKSKPAHIVIKPICDCRPKSKKSTSKKHCCFLIDSVCPYHQNRYDSVSNEILEITGLCNSHKNPSKNKIEFEAINNPPNEEKGLQVWDSLNFLPPQLPPFLNFDYR